MSEPRPPASLEEAAMAIQRHRMAIVEAQQRVLRKELTMPEYNEIYKQHLEKIHALERRIMELQGAGQGQGHQHGHGHGHGHGDEDEDAAGKY